MAEQKHVVHVLLAVFDRENEAAAAMIGLSRTAEDERFELVDAATVLRDAESQLHVALLAPVSRDVKRGKSGLANAVLGLVFPPSTLAMATTDAASGGSYGRFRDRGVTNEDLETAGTSMRPGQSILIAVARPTSVNKIARHIQGYAKLDEYELNPESGYVVAV